MMKAFLSRLIVVNIVISFNPSRRPLGRPDAPVDWIWKLRRVSEWRRRILGSLALTAAVHCIMRECQVSYSLGIKKRILKSTKQDWVQWRERVSGAVRGTMQPVWADVADHLGGRRRACGSNCRWTEGLRSFKMDCNYYFPPLSHFMCGGWTLCLWYVPSFISLLSVKLISQENKRRNSTATAPESSEWCKQVFVWSDSSVSRCVRAASVQQSGLISALKTNWCPQANGHWFI